MAKNEVNEKKKGSGGRGVLIFFVILILLIGGLGALIKFDVASLGTKVIGPKLVNVPIVNLILPEMESAEDLEGDGTTYSFETVEEAIEALKATDLLLKEKEEMVETLSEDLLTKQAEVERLQIFEENQLAFEEVKTEVDQLIAENAGEEAFAAYVESVYQENALEIYELIVKEQLTDTKAQVVVDLYENMEASSAAALLETNAQADIDMVVYIVSHLSEEHAGEILSLMSTDIADRVIRYMYPEEK